MLRATLASSANNRPENGAANAGCWEDQAPDPANMPARPQTMLEALAWAARRTRATGQLSRLDIAERAGLEYSAVARFEQGRAWPVNPERLIDSYAQLAGLHPREIWQAAVNAWANGS